MEMRPQHVLRLCTLLYLAQTTVHCFSQSTVPSPLMGTSSESTQGRNSSDVSFVTRDCFQNFSPEDANSPLPECSLSALLRSLPDSFNASQFQTAQLSASDTSVRGCDFTPDHGNAENNTNTTWHILNATLTWSSEDAELVTHGNVTNVPPPSRLCLRLKTPPSTMLVLRAVNIQSWMRSNNEVEVEVNGERHGLEALAKGEEVVVREGEALLTVHKVRETFRGLSSPESLQLAFEAVPLCATEQLQVKCPIDGFVEARVDLVFLLDSSASVTEPNFELVKSFVQTFVENANIDSGNVRMGVITYSTTAHIQFYLNSFTTREDILEAVSSVSYTPGGTNTADALRAVRTEFFTETRGDRPGIPNFVMHITDGLSDINSERTVPEAEQARRENIHIVTIGVGVADTREMDRVSCKPVEVHRFTVQKFTDLAGIMDRVFSNPKPGYIQTFNWKGHRPYYPSTEACTTLLPPSSSPGHVIMVSTVMLELELCQDCTCDYLEIFFTRACAGAPELRVCTFLHALRTPSGVLSVRFRSDGRRQRGGFRLLFSFHPARDPPKRLRSGKWDCSGDRGGLISKHFVCLLQAFCVGGEDSRESCPRQQLCGESSVVLGDRCYRYVRLSRRSTWVEASTACRNKQGYLASLNTEQEWRRVAEFWGGISHAELMIVGLAQISSSSSSSSSSSNSQDMPDMYSSLWRWSDGTIAYFVNISYPSEMMYSQSCGFFFPHQQHLTAGHCNAPVSGSILCEMGSPEGLHKETVPPQKIEQPLPSRTVSTLPQMSACPNNGTTYTFLQCDGLSHCHKYRVDQTEDCLREHPELAQTMFRCGRQKQMVHYTLVCDYRPDCLDGSDEDFCVQPPCPPSRFSCRGTKQCLSNDLRCDGIRHCLDGSDEQFCGESTEVRPWNAVPPPAIINFTGPGRITVTPLLTTTPTSDYHHHRHVCPETHFQCPGGGYCLPVYVRCNGVYDCPGAEDEAYCDSYTCPGFYRCRGARTCVHADHLCDGQFQCPQHDDELVCKLACPPGCTCVGFAFVCWRRFAAARYPQLRYLKADYTGMTLGDAASNTQLIHLSLRFCQLKGLGVVSLPNILSLDLSYNSITNVSYSELEKLRNLRYLSLAFNDLLSLDAIQQAGMNYPSLTLLDISGGSTREINNMSFLAFPNLRHLNLSRSTLQTVWEPGFNPLSDLKVLDLSECPMHEFGGNLFKSLTNLEVVHASQFHMCCPAILPEGFSRENCHAPADEVSSCTALLRADVFRVCLVMYALFALLGNSVSFVYRVFGVGVTKKLGFDIFVTHLCVSDFLMGVYLAIVGIADRVYYGIYEWNDRRWKFSLACQTAGFLSMVSNEVSAFLVCCITLERFLLIRFPHKKFHFTPRTALVACILGWTLGLLVAAVPLLPFNPPWDFYSQTGICSPLPITRKAFPGSDYSFFVMIVFNFVLFVLIAVGQGLIFWSIRSHTTKGVGRSSKKAKDMVIARRLLAVVMSDFLCWFPIGLLGLLARSGTAVSGDLNVAMAIFVLPFNSALNPFLYTIHMLVEQRRAAQAKTPADREESVPHVCPVCPQPEYPAPLDASSFVKAAGPGEVFTTNEDEATDPEALKLVKQILERNVVTPERLQAQLVQIIRRRVTASSLNSSRIRSRSVM